MPSSFGTGLASGFVEGWTKQTEQQDAIKRQQKQRDIENNFAIINAKDLPDDVRQNAAQQLQDLMAGKKPGAKGGGALSPILQNLLKMVGKSHGDQQPKDPGMSAPGGGGFSERMPNGQQAPGTGGSQPGAGFPQQQPPPLNTGENGRPTLQGTGPAAADPGNAPKQGPTSTLDTQITNLQDSLGRTTNPFTRQRLQGRLDDLTDAKVKRETEIAKEGIQAQGREELANIRASSAKEVAELKAQQAKELEEARVLGRKDVAEAKAKHDKELEDLREKHRVELKKTMAAINPRTGGGAADTKALTRRFQTIEDKHQQAYLRLNEEVANKKAQAGKLGGTARGQALKDAEDFRKTQSAQIESAYQGEIQQARGSAGGGGKPTSSDRVTVTSPDGKKGTIPRSQLPDAKAQGYKEAA